MPVLSIHLDTHFVYKTVGKVDYKKLLLESDEPIYKAIVYYDKKFFKSLKNFIKALKNIGYETKSLNAFNLATDILNTKADNLLIGAYHFDLLQPSIPQSVIILDETYATAKSLVVSSDVLCDDTGDTSTDNL